MERLLELVRQTAEAAAVGPTGSFADVPAAAREAWTAMVRVCASHGVPVGAIDRDAVGRLVRDVIASYAYANPIDCDQCVGYGRVYPACPYCDDSTLDHTCPEAVVCEQCKGTGKRAKPSWVVPWEHLSDADREVARRLGETVGVYALALLISLPLRFGKESLFQMKAFVERLQETK